MSAELSYSFRSTLSKEEALAIANRLSEQGIQTKTTEDIHDLGASVQGDTLRSKYEVFIHPDDFLKAEAEMKRWAEADLEHIDPEYYLFEYSNAELNDLLMESYNWSKLDVLLAKKILRDRGETVNEELLQAMIEERISEMREPTKANSMRLLLAYVFSIVGGFIGIIAGHHYWKQKRKLPNGEIVSEYDPSTQNQGQIIFWIGIFMMITTVLIKLAQ